MYGQMTAGSWIYIGTQGILQGTYETLAECGQQHFGGSLKGTVTLTGGLGGMGGAQPLAVTMNDGVALCVEVDPVRIERRIKTRYLDRETDDLDDRDRVGRRGAGERRGRLDRAARQRADVLPELVRRGWRPDVVTDQTSAHDPLGGYVPAGLTLDEAAAPAPRRRRRVRAALVRESMARARRRDGGVPGGRRGRVRLREQPARRRRARRAGARPRVRVPGVRAGVRPAAVLRGEGAVPLGGALRRSGGHPARPTARCASCSRRTNASSAGCGWPRSGWRSRGCRRGSAGSATASATAPGWRFNELVASGEVSAPIVIGRDHLDSG